MVLSEHIILYLLCFEVFLINPWIVVLHVIPYMCTLQESARQAEEEKQRRQAREQREREEQVSKILYIAGLV